MLDTEQFGAALRSRGWNLFTGVPCSYLKPLINDALHHSDFLNAANEGEAVAIAAGAWLGGRRPVVLFQNSGLTNAMSPLASLIQPYGIPVLGLVTLRGEPGVPDAPQHTLMGEITTHVLDLLRIPWRMLSREHDEAMRQLDEAMSDLAAGWTTFLVIREKTFTPVKLTAAEPPPLVLGPPSGRRPPMPVLERRDVLHAILQSAPEALLISTTGYTSRDLAGMADRPQHFYMTGSMGCASSIALGVAHTRPDRCVIVIDGDGAALMRLGALPAIGRRQPPNLLHVILDNARHESTGGQSTLSSAVDFAALASASGYPVAHHVSGRDDLLARLTGWVLSSDRKLTMLVVRTTATSASPTDRPERPLTAVARHFREVAGA